MPSDPQHKKRYRTFNTYLHNKFGCRVHKIGLDAGFTCPNRDGTCGTGGCAYCANESFSIHTSQRQALAPLDEQIRIGIKHMGGRFKAEKFIAYFQAYSNTHAPLDELRRTYDVIREYPEVVGLFVSTRPDCVDDGVLDLLASYHDNYLVWLELGLQSASDHTLRSINRGHITGDFISAVQRAHQRDIPVCAHVILGLPGEGDEQMLATAELLTECRVESVKLHCLHVMDGTVLADKLRAGELVLLEQKSYVRLACDFLEHLPPDMIIQRLAVDVQGDGLLGPQWCARGSRETVEMIDLEFERRGSRQGALFS